MPIYEYTCQVCANTFERLRPVSQMDAEDALPRLWVGLSAADVGVRVVLKSGKRRDESYRRSGRRLLRGRWRRLRLLYERLARALHY